MISLPVSFGPFVSSGSPFGAFGFFGASGSTGCYRFFLLRLVTFFLALWLCIIVYIPPVPALRSVLWFVLEFFFDGLLLCSLFFFSTVAISV